MFLLVLVTIGLLFTQINLLASVLIVGTSVIGAYLLKDKEIKKKVVYIALFWATIMAFYGVLLVIYNIFNTCGQYSLNYNAYQSGYYTFWAGYKTTVNLICALAVVTFTVFSVLYWFNKFTIPFVEKTAKWIVGDKEEKQEEVNDKTILEVKTDETQETEEAEDSVTEKEEVE